MGTSKQSLLLNSQTHTVSDPLLTAGTALMRSATSTRGTQSVFTPRDQSAATEAWRQAVISCGVLFGQAAKGAPAARSRSSRRAPLRAPGQGSQGDFTTTWEPWEREVKAGQGTSARECSWKALKSDQSCGSVKRSQMFQQQGSAEQRKGCRKEVTPQQEEPERNHPSTRA